MKGDGIFLFCRSLSVSQDAFTARMSDLEQSKAELEAEMQLLQASDGERLAQIEQLKQLQVGMWS